MKGIKKEITERLSLFALQDGLEICRSRRFHKENEMQPGDNPPVGILLCTRKGKKMVEYALACMDNNLFVSTYMLQIPDKKTLEDFLIKQLNG